MSFSCEPTNSFEFESLANVGSNVRSLSTVLQEAMLELLQKAMATTRTQFEAVLIELSTFRKAKACHEQITIHTTSCHKFDSSCWVLQDFAVSLCGSLEMQTCFLTNGICDFLLRAF
jgi:hypothetical protein